MSLKYRLTVFPAIECKDYSESSEEFHFQTKAELIAASNTCAQLLVFIQDELSLMDDYSNMFIREVFINGEWEELEDD